MRDSTFSRMCWMAARGANVLGEDLVRLSANDFRSACDKSRNTSDAIAARLLPIHIDGIFGSAVLEYRPRFLHGQPHRLRDLQKHFLVGEVTAFDKIGFVESGVNLLEPRLRIGPFRKLLRQPAVIRVRAPVKEDVRRPSTLSSARAWRPDRGRGPQKDPSAKDPRTACPDEAESRPTARRRRNPVLTAQYARH